MQAQIFLLMKEMKYLYWASPYSWYGPASKISLTMKWKHQMCQILADNWGKGQNLGKKKKTHHTTHTPHQAHQILTLESLLIPFLTTDLAPLSSSWACYKNGLAAHETITDPSHFTLEYIRLNSTKLSSLVCGLYILVVQCCLQEQSRYSRSK